MDHPIGSTKEIAEERDVVVDRLQAAQSLAERAPLVSRDEVFDPCGSRRIW